MFLDQGGWGGLGGGKQLGGGEERTNEQEYMIYIQGGEGDT